METPPKPTEISLKEKVEHFDLSPFFNDFKNLNQNKGAINFNALENHYKEDLATIGLEVGEKYDESSLRHYGALLYVSRTNRFTSYLDVIDWKKPTQMQIENFRGLVELLISETKKEYGSNFSQDNKLFIDFFDAWPKIIEKCEEISKRDPYIVKKIMKTLKAYQTAFSEDYLNEYVLADKNSFTHGFETKLVNSTMPNISNEHKFMDIIEYRNEWNEKVFDLLRRIEKNPKADLVYEKVLDYASKAIKAANEDLMYTPDQSFRIQNKTGTSRNDMMYTIESILKGLAQLKIKFDLNKKND